MSITITCDCGASYHIDENYLGKSAKCKKCNRILKIQSQEREVILTEDSVLNGASCPICKSPFYHEEAITKCPDCNTAYHRECWEENGGCGIYGCSQVPITEKLTSIEMPASFWGQEDKPCPVCNATIIASAIRCRYCGATFQSARPEDTNEYQEHKAIEQYLPALQKSIIILLIFCIIPFTAPIAAIIGIIWYSSHRKKIKALPRLYSAISNIAIYLGIGQSIFIIIATVLFVAWRT